MSGSDPAGVVIGLPEIYAGQQEMAVTLAEIKGTLALQSQQDRNDQASLKDHESRLRSVETSYISKAGAIGMVLAVSTVVSCIATILAVVIHGGSA